MSEESSAKSSPTRRGLLGGLSVAGAGLIVGATGSPAEATQGQPIIAGQDNTATLPTRLENVSGDTSLSVYSSLAYALYVSSGAGAISAYSDSFSGDNAIVAGANSGDGVHGFSFRKNGVYGLSRSAGATGVYGDNDADGFGVVGRSTGAGVGVWANSPDGTALRTTGKLEIQDRSGLVTVASGKKSVTVTLAGVTAASMILATVQQAGGYFASATPAGGSFTIYLNKAPLSPATVKVAYLVLN